MSRACEWNELCLQDRTQSSSETLIWWLQFHAVYGTWSPQGTTSCLETRKSENKSLILPGQRSLLILEGSGRRCPLTTSLICHRLINSSGCCPRRLIIIPLLLWEIGAGRLFLHLSITHSFHWKQREMPKDVHPPCRAQMAPETCHSEGQPGPIAGSSVCWHKANLHDCPFKPRAPQPTPTGQFFWVNTGTREQSNTHRHSHTHRGW